MIVPGVKEKDGLNKYKKPDFSIGDEVVCVYSNGVRSTTPLGYVCTILDIFQDIDYDSWYVKVEIMDGEIRRRWADRFEKFDRKAILDF